MAEFHPLPSLLLSSTIAPSFVALNKGAERRAKECTPAVMPSLDHLTLADFEVVYEPSDDTFLLLDAISLLAKANWDTTTNQSYTTLEIGCGTGVPTIYLAQLLQEHVPNLTHVHYCTDINPHALRIAQATAEAQRIEKTHDVDGSRPILQLQTIQCHLATDLLPKLEHAVDVLLFNPPYVPTPDDEVGSLSSDCQRVGIEASWAGGVNGRRVIDEAIPQIAQLLKKPIHHDNNLEGEGGVAYMITVDDNLPENLKQEFEKLGLLMEPWVRRKARNEYLTVQRITWI